MSQQSDRSRAHSQRAGPGPWASACASICSALLAVFVVAGQAEAEAGPPAQSPTCPAGESAKNCLASLSADLDGDNQPDQVGVIYDPDARLYTLVVYTKDGRSFWPFRAGFDPKTDKVSLSVRNGKWDPRCRAWGPCGYAIESHDLPDNVLYLSDSKSGDFVIYMRRPYGKDYNKDGYFMIMPALDGDPSRAPLPGR